MEKKLLLLGLLHSREMHGYEIGELLQNHCINAVKLKKANAYRLLDKLEQEGLATHRLEREGSRPQRRVYSLTAEGEEAFLRLLRENLRSLKKPEFPNLVGLDFLSLLPASEASVLLSERLNTLEKELNRIDQISESVRRAHPSMEYMHQYYSFELRWLQSILKRLEC